MDEQPQKAAFGDVVGDATRHLGSLLTLDARLLQAEMKQKTSTVITSGLSGAIALVCFLLGAIALMQCLIFALIWLGLAPIWAALGVGVCLCLIGLICLSAARTKLTGWTLMPERTMSQVGKDLATLKEGIRHVAT